MKLFVHAVLKTLEKMKESAATLPSSLTVFKIFLEKSRNQFVFDTLTKILIIVKKFSVFIIYHRERNQ